MRRAADLVLGIKSVFSQLIRAKKSSETASKVNDGKRGRKRILTRNKPGVRLRPTETSHGQLEQGFGPHLPPHNRRHILDTNSGLHGRFSLPRSAAARSWRATGGH